MNSQDINFYNEDCLVGMERIGTGTVDMILCDLPQGITPNHWDRVLPLDSLWTQYARVIKDNGAIVLFGNGMFTAKLMASNPKMWRYNLIWEKSHPSGFLNSNRMPLRTHEDICVFYKRLPTYNPQKTFGHPPVHSYTKHTHDGSNYGKTKLGVSGGGSTERFPCSILRFASDKQVCNLHPTQKPVALLEWFIKTYTNPGETVLDNCAGSASTAIACINTDRRFIGFEKDRGHYYKGFERIAVALDHLNLEV